MASSLFDQVNAPTPSSFRLSQRASNGGPESRKKAWAKHQTDLANLRPACLRHVASSRFFLWLFGYVGETPYFETMATNFCIEYQLEKQICKDLIPVDTFLTPCLSPFAQLYSRVKLAQIEVQRIPRKSSLTCTLETSRSLLDTTFWPEFYALLHVKHHATSLHGVFTCMWANVGLNVVKTAITHIMYVTCVWIHVTCLSIYICTFYMCLLYIRMFVCNMYLHTYISSPHIIYVYIWYYDYYVYSRLLLMCCSGSFLDASHPRLFFHGGRSCRPVARCRSGHRRGSPGLRSPSSAGMAWSVDMDTEKGAWKCCACECIEKMKHDRTWI